MLNKNQTNDYYQFHFVFPILQKISMKIIIINGPNLNLLGKREPEVYGNQTLKTILRSLKINFLKIETHYFQSNIEGELITKIQDVGFSYDGLY